MRYLLTLMTLILVFAGLVIGAAHVIGGLVGYADFAGNGSLGNIAQAPGYAYADNGSHFLGGPGGVARVATTKGQGDPAAAEAFRKRLDSPLRVIVQVIPEKWIEWEL